MTDPIVGGLRRRLIKDSFYTMMNTALTDLGWYKKNTGLMNEPFVFLSEQVDTEQAIKPNTVGFSFENMVSSEVELGSDLTEDRWNVYVDILAEDEAVGTHLSGDIMDILRGKFTKIGRGKPSYQVYDLKGNEAFIVGFDNVDINRVRDWVSPHNKFWWIVACEAVDYYYDDLI